MPTIAFVTAPGQQGSPLDLVEALCAELREQRIDAVTTADFEAVGSAVPVLVGPAAIAHRLAGAELLSAGLLKRAACMLVDAADSRWEPAVSLAGACGAVVAQGPGAAEELRTRGIAAEHVALGASPLWAHAGTVDRDLDVVFVGAADQRRTRVLAQCADVLARLRSKLVLVDPSSANPTAGWPSLEHRIELLARSRVLLMLPENGDGAMLDAVAALQAAQNDCVVVTEHCRDSEPFRVGHEIATARTVALPDVLAALLADEDRRAQLAAEALAAARKTPLAETAARIAQLAAELAAAHPPPPADERPTRPLLGCDPPPAPPIDPLAVVAGGLKEVRTRMRRLERRLAREDIALRMGRPAPAAERYAASPAWEGRPPRVSIVVPVFQHAKHVGTALDSVLAGDCRDVELVVVDDGSDDGSAEAAASWARARPDVPALVVRHPVNRGLPAARNTALAFARGELAFMLDADNQLLPQGLRRLVEALDRNPSATFAYGIVQRFDADGPCGLVSMFPWAPERLRIGNDIDAMALIRVAALRELGGYADEPPFDGGWEDYELWCRIADAGGHATFVPQIVGRYLVGPGSLLSLTNLSLDDLTGALAQRYPDLIGRDAGGRDTPTD